jgi:hypothetical protein
MQQLGSVFTRHVNERLGRDGPLFRGRFRSIAVTDDRQLLATTRYIHRNALDIVGVTDVAGYRWSSHRTYLGLRAAPPWLRTEIVLAYFAGDPDQFARFVSGDAAPSGLRQAACELLGSSPTPAALARARRAARAEPVLLTVADRVRQLCA